MSAVTEFLNIAFLGCSVEYGARRNDHAGSHAKYYRHDQCHGREFPSGRFFSQGDSGSPARVRPPPPSPLPSAPLFLAVIGFRAV